MDHARNQRPASILGLSSSDLSPVSLARSRREPILRSPTRKHVFVGRDGGAKPWQRPRLARQRRHSAGVRPSNILKTREFSALRGNTRFRRMRGGGGSRVRTCLHLCPANREFIRRNQEWTPRR